MAIDLSTDICGVKLNNPTVLASGILGVTPASWKNVVDNGAGAITTKSISQNPRTGHPNPVMLTYHDGMLNAVGLSNSGAQDSLKKIKEFKKICDAPLIVNVVNGTIKEFGDTVELLSEAKPDLFEINVSCPNVDDEWGKPFACDPDLSAQVTKEVKSRTDIPVLIKLSPNVANIAIIAKAVEAAGADGISAINTAGPGMAIDITTRSPILANQTGGISGPALKPLAVGCVFQIYKAVKIPILGIGGVLTGEDAVEMIMAGARAVSIGTGVYYRGEDIFKKVSKEIEAFMQKHNYEKITDLIGAAHQS
ncbi:MAG: dihydroorotate dehydrogenase [Candidatus Buchananbacteria bacterium CG10_big_fil_rev_8_21_14_0_10_42_9]|uniref:Dihydroorotate dehydrogenase n=1 Tax=Candidatus Buchananbacteria bacterium CG10_big_fil_rev_8_21_14_0_10_42_9 TaxID=1974526 RepID=A0A2H0W4Q1_9BACT|nr:MAG: dihydroorotate dehydrogenase [Candidatus Buchananbacteria bacterium CG10_big_fil_rev_8_21_14_0_10_42_9]